MGRTCIFIKNTKDKSYVKKVNTHEGTLEFTDDANEALDYKGGQWFAESELEFIKFHMGDKYGDKVMNMTVQCEAL